MFSLRFKVARILSTVSTIRYCANYSAVKLFCKKYGEKTQKTPVVMVHGAYGSYKEFVRSAEEINKATSRQVLCVGLTNHGESGYRTLGWTHASMAHDLKGFLEEQDLPSAVFVAHSLGGYACLKMAMMYPQSLEALISIDVSPVSSSMVPYEMAFKGALALCARFDKQKPLEEVHAEVDAYMEKFFPNRSIRKYFLRNLIADKNGTVRWDVNVAGFQEPASVWELGDICDLPEGSTFTKPSLFIAGTLSDCVKKTDESGILRYFPAAQFRYIESGHSVHLEKPNEFLHSVLEFLKEIACNRTFYGDVGRTYELEIRRPREDRLPFLCHLNFTAGGGDFGDLVQLTFDTFTVGKFVSFTSEGCPDGYMSIREQDRPPTGGQWCGSAWGYTVFYSESPSLNLSLHLFRLSEQGIGYNFDFKLAYKFLRRSEAHLRYGNSTLQPWRGDLVPGTYCDRVLDRCDTRPCRVQSPNFPGVYPRNVTCYYRLEQRNVPSGKHALLAVRQRNTHKIHIKDQIVKYDRSQRVLKVWDQCNVIQDYLTVYDGGSTVDPILVRLCGGDVVPDIVSSGPSMLLEFHTSGFDNPFHPVPLSYLPGFELEVQVIYVDALSKNYVRPSSPCEFTINSYESPWGLLENPKHSLPPNTTCRYNFEGHHQETVWLSFIKYYAASPELASYDSSSECNSRLRVWDGPPPPSEINSNLTLLGEFCKDDVPRLCDHNLLSNATRFTRPCSLAESYVSSGSSLTLEQFLRQGSALFPFSFLLRYEFVDTTQEGSPDRTSDNPCDRVFSSSFSPSTGRFHSPRSVFFYGRGGAQNVTCTLRFEAASSERVRLTFTKAKFGGRSCFSRIDPRTDRYQCYSVTRKTSGIAELWISEYPWPGIQIPKDCLCSELEEPLVIRTLTSSVVEVNFTVTLMNITQGFNDFNFEGEYQFLDATQKDEDGVEICPGNRESRRLLRASGDIRLSTHSNSLRNLILDTTDDENLYEKEDLTGLCVNYPWLIEPEDSLNNFIYLKTPGFEISSSAEVCPTLNRVLIYSGTDTRHPYVICPATASTFELFSAGWNSSWTSGDSLALLGPHARSFVVEFVEREYGNHMVSWMEVSKRPPLTATSSFVMESAPNDCPYRCPELNACISSALWCDDVRHCPSGFDEDDNNCAFQLGVPLLYVVVGIACFAVLAILLLITICVKCQNHRRNERKKSQSANHLHVNHIHSSSEGYGLGLGNSIAISKRFPTSAHDDLYMGHLTMGLDGKDSLC